MRNVIRTMKEKSIPMALIQEPYNIVLPEEYSYIRNSSTAKAVIIHSKELKLQAHLCTDNFASVKIQLKNKPLIVASAYIEPLNIERFDQFEATAEGLSMQGSLIIAGDFNARHDTWDRATNAAGKRLVDMLDSTELELIIPEVPTFMNSNGSSTIDLALHTPDISAVTAPLDWIIKSDHRPLTHTFGIRGRLPRKPPTISSRIFNEGKEQLEELKTKLGELSWDTLPIDKHLLVTLNDTLHMMASSTLGRKKKRPRRLPKHWERSEEYKLLYKKTQKVKKILSTLSADQKQARWPELCTLKDRLQELERHEAKQHWEKFIESQDPWGPAYRIVKQKISPNVSERFPGNDRLSFYENLKILFPGLRLEPLEKIVLSEAEHEEEGFRWVKVSTDWLVDRLQNASIRKAPGIDGITGSIARQIPVSMAAKLARGMNECLRAMHFPDELKTANVTMIPKPGKTNYQDPKAFRPISLLPWMGKTLELVINEHLQPISIVEMILNLISFLLIQ